MKPRLGLLLASLSLLSPLAAATSAPPPATASAQPVETPEQHDHRMAWWREARFGMFIHWGIYSVPAGIWRGEKIPGIGEWIMNHAKIPVADYAAFAAEFNPVKFDAEAWVRTAKAAGMTLIAFARGDEFVAYAHGDRIIDTD